MNEFILKESISPAGLECPAEFEHYIITDGKTTILAKDDSEGHEQALMLLAVMNAYGGTIWVDDSHKLIISHQKEQIDAMTTALAAKDAEIEQWKLRAEMLLRTREPEQATIDWATDKVIELKNAEIERLKALCLKQFDDMMDEARKQGATEEIIAARRPQYIKENNL